MKRIIFTLIVFALMASVSMAGPILGPLQSAKPGYFTIPTNDMASFDLMHRSPAGGGMIVGVDMNGGDPGVGVDMWPALNNTEFQLKFVNGPDVGWRDDLLGWSLFDPGTGDDTLPSAYFDLSGWEGWRISFHNEEFVTGQQPLQAQLIMNIGWTDPDWNHPDLYVQGPMLTAYPCEPIILEMDFSSVEAWGMLASGAQVSGDVVDISDDMRLGYVSTLGLKIGSDVYPADPAFVKICLDTNYIPAPGAIILGSIGVGLVGWLRRRRTL